MCGLLQPILFRIWNDAQRIDPEVTQTKVFVMVIASRKVAERLEWLMPRSISAMLSLSVLRKSPSPRRWLNATNLPVSIFECISLGKLPGDDPTSMTLNGNDELGWWADADEFQLHSGW
jgi:hypothetical protein